MVIVNEQLSIGRKLMKSIIKLNAEATVATENKDRIYYNLVQRETNRLSVVSHSTDKLNNKYSLNLNGLKKADRN